MSRRRCRSWLLVLGAALPCSCAWANPANRPIWNAFEHNLVPASDGWFYATLPVTVPLGLGSVLLDTFVAHPLQTVDDAVEDAGELWVEGDPDFTSAYYTEMAYLPFRVVFTPLVFAGSFAGRSLFDIRGHEQQAEELAQLAAESAREERREFAAWLERVVVDPDASHGGRPPTWHESFAAPLQRALAANALVRRAVHLELLDAGMTEYGDYRAEPGLRDPDAIVRYEVVTHWPAGAAIAPQLVATLREDPVESVRLAARCRFPGR